MDGCACVLLVTGVLVTTLAEHLHTHTHHQLSPSDAGLRPAGLGDDLPPLDLLESPNRSHDPRPTELNATALAIKLGRNLDPAFMSVTRPAPASQLLNSNNFLYRRNRRGRLVPVGDMPKHLRDMDFKFLRLPDGSKLRTRVSTKLKKKLQQFLWAFTACPIAYKWKDLGIRFWPRWLKEGHCPAGKTSCSVPPGMKCRPSATLRKTVLRWHCRSPIFDNSALQPEQRHCQWIKVEYPIITQCSCACPHTYS